MSINSSTSILKRIIEDSLRSFPDDAHQKVLQFLLESGLDEKNSLKFRQAWSKVVLGTHAFGKGEKNINPELFSEDLIRELSYSDDTVTKLLNTSLACLKYDNKGTYSNSINAIECTKNSLHTIAALDAVNSAGNDLARILSALYKEKSGYIDRQAANTELIECIGLFRKSLRGSKMNLGGSILSSTASYTPLDSNIHGLPDLVKGTLDMQTKTERNDLNFYMSTNELVGVKVSNKQPIHQEHAWNAYLCLNELLSCKSLNLFPLPVGVLRDTTNLSITFAFECAMNAKPLSRLLGPVLSTYLRRLPHVVHRWCAQLAQAHWALQNCSGTLSKPIRVNSDVFVRDNGQLQVGNIGFDAAPPSSYQQGSSRNFLRSCCEILKQGLCLSRTEKVELSEDDAVGSVDGAEEVESAGDQVLAVVVGSTLELVVSSHGCTEVAWLDGAVGKWDSSLSRSKPMLRGGQRETSPSPAPSSPISSAAGRAGTLLVNAAVSVGTYTDYVDVASVSSGTTSGFANTMRLRLRALRAGVLSLHLSAATSESSEGRRCKMVRLKVILIPAYPVESVLLQDLIAHLEESESRLNPELLLHSQLFLRQERSVDAGGTDEDTTIREVQKDWQDIIRIIGNHGNLSVPKIR